MTRPSGRRRSDRRSRASGAHREGAIRTRWLKVGERLTLVETDVVTIESATMRTKHSCELGRRDDSAPGNGCTCEGAGLELGAAGEPFALGNSSSWSDGVGHFGE
jgi:hypothetical protein